MQRMSGDERGIAMVTAILTSAVVLTLSITAFSLANHAGETTALDRARTQAVHGAEAGINRLLKDIQNSRTEELPCGTSGETDSQPVARYTTEVTYYRIFGDPTSAITSCPLSSGDQPRGAYIKSVGSATGLSAVTRTVEAQYRLSPIIGAFNSAIFSDSGAGLGNQTDVFGNGTYDGDVYTNGNWTCRNNVEVRGSVFSQGYIDIDSCDIFVDVWANDYVSIKSAHVGEDAASSTADITITNTPAGQRAVERHASSGQACNGCNSTTVGGVISTNTPLQAPPKKDFPKVAFDADAWSAEGYDVKYFDTAGTAACTNAQSYIENEFAAAVKDTVVRISERCEINFSNNALIALPHNLAIVSDGAITISQQTRFEGVGGVHDLHFLVPYYYHPDDPVETNEQECEPGNQGDISVGNRTTFTDVQISAYSPCTVTFANQNVGNGGQIYGGTVEISNRFEITYQPILIPGSGDVTGYNLDPAFIREVQG